jgi:membrane protease YdiL (CAAX protease family)
MPGRDHQRKNASPGFPSVGRFGKVASMRNAARGDVWKVWIYALAVVMLGAWISPFFYNAGKALAEVSSSKTTNGVLEWLADRCRQTGFPGFHKAAMLLVALVLFVPWMEWLHARRGNTLPDPASPWRIRLPGGAAALSRGQPLKRNLRGFWHGCSGFLVVAGLMLPMNMVLVPGGILTLRHPGDSMPSFALAVLARSLVPALVMEVFFRGIVLGVFMRAMKPAAGMAMSAAFFALAMAVIPSTGLNVADPDASGTGFELLGRALARFADWRCMLESFAPLLAFGLVLAYARWRTASLWLPVGLHTGWIFAQGMLTGLGGPHGAMDLAGVFQFGLVPLAAAVVAGLLAHFLTDNHGHETAVRP